MLDSILNSFKEDYQNPRLNLNLSPSPTTTQRPTTTQVATTTTPIIPTYTVDYNYYGPVATNTGPPGGFPTGPIDAEYYGSVATNKSDTSVFAGPRTGRDPMAGPIDAYYRGHASPVLSSGPTGFMNIESLEEGFENNSMGSIININSLFKAILIVVLITLVCANKNMVDNKICNLIKVRSSKNKEMCHYLIKFILVFIVLQL